MQAVIIRAAASQPATFLGDVMGPCLYQKGMATQRSIELKKNISSDITRSFLALYTMQIARLPSLGKTLTLHSTSLSVRQQIVAQRDYASHIVHSLGHGSFV